MTNREFINANYPPEIAIKITNNMTNFPWTNSGSIDELYEPRRYHHDPNYPVAEFLMYGFSWNLAPEWSNYWRDLNKEIQMLEYNNKRFFTREESDIINLIME